MLLLSDSLGQIEFKRTFSAAHRVAPHKGHCHRIHGHNYHVDVAITSSHLDENGFVVDWGVIKPIIDRFDHVLIMDAADPMLERLGYCINNTQVGVISYSLKDDAQLFPVYGKNDDWIVTVDGPPTTERLAATLAKAIAYATAEVNDSETIGVWVTLAETDNITAKAEYILVKGAPARTEFLEAVNEALDEASTSD